MANGCSDPKVMITVELEREAIRALLDDSYKTLKDWEYWEPRHNARSPLRLRFPNRLDVANFAVPMYRIEMRCEQAEALRERSEELAEILAHMPAQADREASAALSRAARAFDETIRRRGTE
jgi:hypothetical protein